MIHFHGVQKNEGCRVSIRDRRLLGDRQRVEVLNGNSDLIAVTWTSDRPEKYVVKYSCKGLYLPEGSNVPSITNHQIGRASCRERV